MKNLNTAFFWVGLLIAFAPATVFADHNPFGDKDDVTVRYKAALARNDIEQAVSIVCNAARNDPKKYEKRCISAQQDASKQLQKLDGFFIAGKKELGERNYAGAVRDLGKVTAGSHKDEALALLKEASEGLAHPQLLATNRVTLGVAQAAYARGDLIAAKLNASEIKASELLPIAQQMLNNIRAYEDAMQQASQAVREHNYAAAQQKYRFALAVNANGPGDPGGKLQELVTLSNSAKVSPSSKAENAILARPTTPDTKKAEAVNSTGGQEKLKVALADAHAAELAKNTEAAVAAYDRALAINPKLAEAVAGKQSLLDLSQKTARTTEARLAGGIRSYYTSHFTESAAALSLYLTAPGTHNKGAAHFYLGATMAAEALLSDPKVKSDSDTLQQQALHEFQLARREHYQPVQRYLSPRILALWNESPG